LWDNTFCIPLAGIGVAAYCDFLITRRRWPLLLAAICLGAMTLVHLMSVALVAAVFIHFVIFERRWLCRFWWGLLLVGILWACAFLPYLKALLFLYQPRDGAGESPWNGWWHPLLGGQLLTAFHWLDVTRPHLCGMPDNLASPQSGGLVGNGTDLHSRSQPRAPAITYSGRSFRSVVADDRRLSKPF